MRHILVLAAVVIAGGGYAARFADHELAPQAAAVQPAEATRAPVASGYGSLTLEADHRGHFKVEARVEGRDIAFIVDTGASLVALRESDAARIGIRPMRSDYNVTVTTANGSIKAARAKIDRVELGEIAVEDVAALVLPDEALSENLLGVSFLSRLKRYEYANGRLVLEQ